jgi:hypothetical protein
VATPRALNPSTGILCGGEVVDAGADHTFEGIAAAAASAAAAAAGEALVIAGVLPPGGGQPIRRHAGRMRGADQPTEEARTVMVRSPGAC